MAFYTKNKIETRIIYTIWAPRNRLDREKYTGEEIEEWKQKPLMTQIVEEKKMLHEKTS